MNKIDRIWADAIANGGRDPGTGLYLRDRGDAGIIIQQAEWKWVSGYDYHGQTILDLGGHIGAAAQYLRHHTGGAVVSVECDPGNAAAFLRNWPDGSEGVQLVQAAVTSGIEPEVELYLGKTYTSTHTIRPVRGRAVVVVPTVSFHSLLRKHKPALIKCDIEGAEYALDWSILPDSCTEICLEYHYARPEDLQRQLDMDALMLGMGFRHLKEPANRVTFRKCCTAAYTRRPANPFLEGL